MITDQPAQNVHNKYLSLASDLLPQVTASDATASPEQIAVRAFDVAEAFMLEYDERRKRFKTSLFQPSIEARQKANAKAETTNKEAPR